MMTHRALVHEYVSCIVGLDLREDDAPLHSHAALPLGPDARLPAALPRGRRDEPPADPPDVATILERVETHGIGSLFLAAHRLGRRCPTTRPSTTRDLSSLRKAYYGASIMPVPVLRPAAASACPELGFYNCFGQSEIGPLATVLRPEEHAERPEACGRTVLFVEARVVDAEGTDVAAGRAGRAALPLAAAVHRLLGQAGRDGRGLPRRLVPLRRPRRAATTSGYLTVVDRIKDVINTGGVLVASREVEDALYTHPAVAEVAVIATPHERWIEAVTAVVVLRDGQTVTETELVDHARATLAPLQAAQGDPLRRRAAPQPERQAAQAGAARRPGAAARHALTERSGSADGDGIREVGRPRAHTPRPARFVRGWSVSAARNSRRNALGRKYHAVGAAGHVRVDAEAAGQQRRPADVVAARHDPEVARIGEPTGAEDLAREQQVLLRRRRPVLRRDRLRGDAVGDEVCRHGHSLGHRLVVALSAARHDERLVAEGALVVPGLQRGVEAVGEQRRHGAVDEARAEDDDRRRSGTRPTTQVGEPSRTWASHSTRSRPSPFSAASPPTCSAWSPSASATSTRSTGSGSSWRWRCSRCCRSP